MGVGSCHATDSQICQIRFGRGTIGRVTPGKFESCPALDTKWFTLRPQVRDLSPQVEALLMAHYRSLSGDEKLKLAFEQIEFIRATQRHEIRRIHPEAGPREVELRLASRWCDPELLMRAFGWNVKVEGY